MPTKSKQSIKLRLGNSPKGEKIEYK